MSIKEQICAEIERLKKEVEDHNYYLDTPSQGLGYSFALDDILSFIDSLPEQPVEGLDVTDFCKPIDPKIARYVADHWWEMIGEESTNKPTTEGLEEAADAHIRRVVDAAGHPGWDWETQDVKDGFIAGAEWQYQKDRREFAKIKAKTWCEGFDAYKQKMLDEAVEGVAEELYNDGEIHCTVGVGTHFKPGDKVKVIVIKDEN